MYKEAGLELIYEKRILLKEYSEGFLKKEIQRLRLQAPPLITNDVIRQTIVRFDQLKTSKETGERIKNIVQEIVPAENARNPEKENIRVDKLKKSPFDITLYSWKDLEFVVHQFVDPAERRALKDRVSKTDSEQTKNDTGAELIYESDDLVIYFGKNKEECIDFAVHMHKINPDKNSSQQQGRGLYNWCIGWVNNNQFDNYRYSSGGRGASVYYVVDKARPTTDELHVVVVHAQQDGNFRITNAFNNRENVATWEQIISASWQPKLRGLEEHIRFIPYTPEEEIKLIKDGGLRPSNFKYLKTFKGKQSYITQGGKIFKESFLTLDPLLQHNYINVQCHPDNADPNMHFRFRKIFFPFADQSSEDTARLVSARDKMIEILETITDEEYAAGNKGFAPYFEDPIIMQSKSQTYKLWKKFATHILDAMINNVSEERGYAQV